MQIQHNSNDNNKINTNNNIFDIETNFFYNNVAFFLSYLFFLTTVKCNSNVLMKQELVQKIIIFLALISIYHTNTFPTCQ